MNRFAFALLCASSLTLSTGCGGDETKDSSSTETNTTATATTTGTTTTPTTTGTTGTTTTTGTTMVMPTAEEYCATVTTACTADNAQYADEAACLDYVNTASGMPLGVMGDTDGNSIACRSYHAGVAATTDADTHCSHAGPSGGDVCGDWCTNYCDLAATNCSGANELYADTVTCMDSCALISDLGAPNDASGNTVQCRIYHLGVAGSDVAGGSADLHCAHGAPGFGGPCAD